jgi:hypothetical protein
MPETRCHAIRDGRTPRAGPRRAGVAAPSAPQQAVELVLDADAIHVNFL